MRDVGTIDTPYDHLNFSKGLSNWIRRHDQYATEEARLAFSLRTQTFEWQKLFSRNTLTRKRALKQLQVRLPARWICKFLFLYLARRGFLDGYPGFIYCALQAFYDLLICLKVREIEATAPSWQGASPEMSVRTWMHPKLARR